MKKILVVEDDFDIQELIQTFLEEDGYKVVVANDGIEACDLFLNESFDFIVLDIMLPKMDGFAVCEFIRKKSDIPILMLTALSSEDNQIKGFDLQVDDYITKPFSALVLVKKIAAILRRSGDTNTNQTLAYKNLKLDLSGYKAYVNGKYIELTSKEFEILREFLIHQGIIFTRRNFISQLWNDDFFVDEQIINTHIKNIRKKLGVDFITTVRGVGYRVDKDI